MNKEKIKAIASRMKVLRQICDCTVEKICSVLSVDKETYLSYEAGSVDIPIGFLYSFANYFNVELVALLTGDEPKLHDFSIVRAGKGLEVERNKPYKYTNLAYNFQGKKAEPFMVTVLPNDDELEQRSHEGQEINYVVEGKLLIKIEDHEVVLEEGDCLYFHCSKKHGMKALDGKAAKFLAIIIA
ncbi:cupin domain-containing protein [Puteibacter caeruleilacunae]|nr:cupin domain-containing protein [Puteibacter caeruleilacunae]